MNYIYPQFPPIELYAVQKAARESTQSKFFPCYSQTYINTEREKGPLKGNIIWLYSKFYDVTDGVYQSLCAVTNVIKKLSCIIFSHINYFLKPILGPIINNIYPINPINGKRQLTLISRRVEQFLGEYFIYPFATGGRCSTNTLLPNTRETMDSRAKKILTTLSKEIEPYINPTPKNPIFTYEVTVQPSLEMNAFALPGGGIVLYTQLIEEISNAINLRQIKKTTITFEDQSTAEIDLQKVTLDDVLAALLGHEMVHIAARHSILSCIIDSLICTVTYYIPRLEPLMEYCLSPFYSRKQEYEADITGMYFAQKAGYNPLGTLYLQEVLKLNENMNRWHELFESMFSHPCTENRKKTLFAAIYALDPSLFRDLTLNLNSHHPYDPNRSSAAVQFPQKMANKLSSNCQSKQYQPLNSKPLSEQYQPLNSKPLLESNDQELCDSQNQPQDILIPQNTFSHTIFPEEDTEFQMPETSINSNRTLNSDQVNYPKFDSAGYQRLKKLAFHLKIHNGQNTQCFSQK